MTDRHPYECPTWPQCAHECLRDGQTIVAEDRWWALAKVAAEAKLAYRGGDLEEHDRCKPDECHVRALVVALAELEALP